MHPFFRHEYTLPQDETFDRLISARRMRGSASLPSSSPAPSPTHTGPIAKLSKKGKSKLKDMAGLISGDSDSSALTQESGDEGAIAHSRDSAAAGTDAGTEVAEEEDAEGSPSEFNNRPRCALCVKRVHRSFFSVSDEEDRKARETRQQCGKGTWWDNWQRKGHETG